MKLPNNIYFTGVPGSMWSAIARTIEEGTDFNKSDRHDSRKIKNNEIRANHQGMYFGQDDKFPATMDREVTNSAYDNNNGCKILKSHNWSEQLENVKENLEDDWIMLVYRDDNVCFEWWKYQGGWKIDYPVYTEYKNDEFMLNKIREQNRNILNFAKEHNLRWENFTIPWIYATFGFQAKEFDFCKEVNNALLSDTLVTIYKP